MRTFTMLIVVVLALFGCSVPGETTDSANDTLNFVTVYPANTTDAHVVQSAFIYNSGTVETLIGIGADGALKPVLATAWATDDGQNWTFTIREGVRFHNGNPLTAEAVRASITDSIEVNPGMAKLLPIAEMSAEGQQLTIRTTEPYPGLPSEFVHFNTAITDVTAEGELPIGTGPFKFDSFDIRGTAELSRFDDHWAGPARLAHVSMTAIEDANARLLALQSGAADLVYRPSTESIAAIEADDRLTVETHPGTRVYHLLHNYAGKYAQLWANEDFRIGFNALIDRDSITGTVMNGHGLATNSPFPGGHPISPEPAELPRGVDAALEHFAAAGLEVAGGKVTYQGAPLDMTIATYIARPELPQIAQVVQNAAAQVGIEMNIVTAENIDEYLQNETWDVATYSANTITRGDGSYFFSGSLTPDGAQNHGQLDVPEINELISRFNSTFEPDQRLAVAREIATHLRDHAYNCYIVAPDETAAFADGVTGWVTPPNEFEYPMLTTELGRA